MSEICVPIKYNEQLIGIIDSEHHEKNFFTRQHLQLLTTIATLVASKIISIEANQRLRSQRAQLADVNDRLAEVQLAALRGQMNPHFIFNALNSIKKFVIANEPANAEKYLGKFSKLIRSILDNSRSGMVTVEKELQLLKLYLDLEQLRFGTKLTYTITVDKGIGHDIEIPSMIVQPFVENAMLHGIMHREDGGKVDIHFILHKEWLEISIEDNGVGRAKSAIYKSDTSEVHHSIGIEVATKRLQVLKRNEDTPAGIVIIDLVDDKKEGIGTKVIIEIPIN
jgi:LytS/YehU family sensor histidine kinase